MTTPMTKKEFREDWEELFRQFHPYELTALMMLYRELVEVVVGRYSSIEQPITFTPLTWRKNHNYIRRTKR